MPVSTDDVPTLKELYRKVLKIEPKTSGHGYAELPTGVGVLSLISIGLHEESAPDSATTGHNRSVELEFLVDDVDAEDPRLHELGVDGSGSSRLSPGAIVAYTSLTLTVMSSTFTSELTSMTEPEHVPGEDG